MLWGSEQVDDRMGGLSTRELSLGTSCLFSIVVFLPCQFLSLRHFWARSWPSKPLYLRQSSAPPSNPCCPQAGMLWNLALALGESSVGLRGTHHVGCNCFCCHRFRYLRSNGHCCCQHLGRHQMAGGQDWCAVCPHCPH